MKALRRALDGSELTEKRALIQSFTKRIINIIGQEAFLTYTMPINSLLEEKIGTLPIVHRWWAVMDLNQ
jgi:site-specific DNA recombinase